MTDKPTPTQDAPDRMAAGGAVVGYVLVALPVQLNTNGVPGFDVTHARACTDCGAVVYDQGLHDRHHTKGATARVVGAVRVNAKAALSAFREGWKDGGSR